MRTIGRPDPRIAQIAVLLGVAVLAAACAPVTTPPPAPPDHAPSEPAPAAPPGPAEPSVRSGTVRVGVLERTYRLLVPSDRGTEARALVLVLHGGFGTPEQAALQTGFDEAAEEHGFLAAYPEGLLRAWNAGGCCGWPQESGLDDVGFLLALVDDLVARYGVDPRRVYATGMSNGGMMAYRLACEAADRVAAVAPVAATLFTECAPSTPVSVLHFHSELDRAVLFEGGLNTGGVVFQDRPPVRDGLDLFRTVNGCGDRATVDTAPHLVLEAWEDCEAGTAVQLALTDDGGHSWPSGQRTSVLLDPPSEAIHATETMWEFFAAHPRS